ncbi:hypothetical protein CUMW_114430 [Citrus unshiu]|nr:hypothetical protein CUMW_114430 [Citrus unshiu]
MRLNGEISHKEDEEDEEEKQSGVLQPERLVVGYALTSKKKKSFLQPKLEILARYVCLWLSEYKDCYRFRSVFWFELCLIWSWQNYFLQRNKGISFVAIDQNRPLSDQGPFDVVLHKLSGMEWCKIIELCSAGLLLQEILYTGVLGTCMLYIFKCQHDGNLDPLTVCSYIFVIFLLKDYRQKHPEVTILDPPDAIKHLHNRQSMLQDVADLNLSDCNGKVRVPRQMVITKDSLSIPDQVFEAGLKLPLVAKPLVVDGSAKSHELFLAYDRFSLSELEPPMLLQEFVNHGGVLFKIYIIGETIKVVRRFSLPNVSKRELAKVVSVFRFPRVSSAAASADDADLDPGIAELPPRPLLERLARELRHRLGLRLFNIDMIREHGMRDVFYVIDINYFPGYGKMPDYEHIFTDFLLSLEQSKCRKRPATAA